MLYKVVVTFKSVDGILSLVIQMKGAKLYFPVVLFLNCLTRWLESVKTQEIF